jgi:hypothetical protein
MNHFKHYSYKRNDEVGKRRKPLIIDSINLTKSTMIKLTNATNFLSQYSEESYVNFGLPTSDRTGKNPAPSN